MCEIHASASFDGVIETNRETRQSRHCLRALLHRVTRPNLLAQYLIENTLTFLSHTLACVLKDDSRFLIILSTDAFKASEELLSHESRTIHVCLVYDDASHSNRFVDRITFSSTLQLLDLFASARTFFVPLFLNGTMPMEFI